MDYFYIITNPQKDSHLETTHRVRNYLESHGKHCQVRTFEKADASPEGNYKYTNADLIPKETQCILVLGGDGTLIQAARDTLKLQIPLLGINMGTLGYLAEIEKNNLEYALDCLMADEYTVEERMMLQGRVFKGGAVISEDYSLNDIVISRHGSLRIIQYDIYVNGAYLNSYSADGVIVATPTGSTGYSLSAGGPIVSPRAAMTILSPICPHTLNTRSIVLSDEDRIQVKVGPGRGGQEEDVLVTFDGKQGLLLEDGDYVEIEKAEQVTKILKISNMSFLEVLRNKMREN